MYKPMIISSEGPGMQISAVAIKTKLILKSEEPSTFFANRNNEAAKPKTANNIYKYKGQHYKGPRCYNCGKYGHISKYWRAPKKNSINQKGNKTGFIAALSAFSDIADQWYIDSCAAVHMTNRNYWMYDITKPPHSHIIL